MTIFEFNDCRDFIRHHISQLPSGGRGELTRIAGALAVNTTLLSQIMSGSRVFTMEQAYKLSQYLCLSELETDYFSLLIQIERAGSADLKRYLEKKLDDLKKEALKLSKRIEHEKSLSDNERVVFYSSWIYSAVHLYSSIRREGVTIEEVATRFQIPRVRAIEVMGFLTRAGLCMEETGRYTMGVQSTFVEKGSPYLLKHHSNWRVKAIQKSESLADSEMMYTGQVSLSKEDFERIRETLSDALKDIMKTVKDSPADEVACLNIDWFWLDR
jgi:uncharacterized protein (TIGR02147 family)